MAGGDAAKAEKIRLSVSDFRYVYDEINTRAQELMRLHFPDKSSDDPLLDGVAHEVQRFINEVFETARHSIIVEDAPDTQIPITELLENAPSGIEPFDLELNKRKRELSALADARTIEVTELRKTQPVRLRERYEQLVQERQQRLASTAAQVREANTEAAGSRPPKLELEDRDESSNEFNELVQRLKVLRELPKTIEQAVELKETVDYIRQIDDDRDGDDETATIEQAAGSPPPRGARSQQRSGLPLPTRLRPVHNPQHSH